MDFRQFALGFSILIVGMAIGTALPVQAAAVPMTTLNGETSGNQFGYAVSAAGDVNADGLADSIVSAPYANATGGAVYIYYGSNGRLPEIKVSAADATILNDGTATHLGLSVAGVGDVNADGYDDVMVSSSGAMLTSYNSYLFYGPLAGTVFTSDADTTITNVGVYPASYVAAAGDVNADGYDDVLVGSTWYGSTPWGQVHLYYGPLPINTVLSFSDADASIYGDGYTGNGSEAYSYEQIGKVMTSGYINADGYSDVLIGVPGTDDAAIYYGPLSGTYTENKADIYFDAVGGDSVAVADDVNADGYTDIAIGDFRDSSYAGAVRVWFGPLASSENDTTADQIIMGVMANDRFGTSLSAMGDTTGDGRSELLVGAQGANNYAGYSYVLRGVSNTGTRTAAVQSLRLSGSAAGDYFGATVASVGDTDGDGRVDYLVGARGASGLGGVGTGIARLIFGR